MTLPAPISGLMAQAGDSVRTAGLGIAQYAALGLIGLVGAGFMLAAFYIWLAAMTNALIAALIVGGLLLAISGIWAAILIQRGKRARLEREAQVANAAVMASTLSLADAGLRIVGRMRGTMFLPAAATLAVAWFLGRRR